MIFSHINTDCSFKIALYWQKLKLHSCSLHHVWSHYIRGYGITPKDRATYHKLAVWSQRGATRTVYHAFAFVCRITCLPTFETDIHISHYPYCQPSFNTVSITQNANSRAYEPCEVMMYAAMRHFGITVQINQAHGVRYFSPKLITSYSLF